MEDVVQRLAGNSRSTDDRPDGKPCVADLAHQLDGGYDERASPDPNLLAPWEPALAGDWMLGQLTGCHVMPLDTSDRGEAPCARIKS
jgi:hypothetical protein